ncbi:MAG TPA: PTS sugar transporter subunit IIB [Firmicutes bacterium]|nr:PTS sugar transporter subunit IIB [Candidatus Fermentithermobacillaceae bacterium]
MSYKILTVCGMGLGSSLMAKMNIEALAKEFGVDARVETADVGTAKGQRCDLLVTTPELARALGTVEGKEVILISNFIRKEEMKEKLKPVFERWKSQRSN